MEIFLYDHPVGSFGIPKFWDHGVDWWFQVVLCSTVQPLEWEYDPISHYEKKGLKKQQDANSQFSVELPCGKLMWKTHGSPKTMIYKWWVFHIYVSLQEGSLGSVCFCDLAW